MTRKPLIPRTVAELVDWLRSRATFDDLDADLFEDAASMLERLAQRVPGDSLEKRVEVAHAGGPDLGEHVPTWQVLLPGFKTPTSTPDKLIIIRADRGRDVVDAVNGRADCNGRWYTPVSPVSPGFYIELPRDQADLDRLLDAEGHKLDANGYLIPQGLNSDVEKP